MRTPTQRKNERTDVLPVVCADGARAHNVKWNKDFKASIKTFSDATTNSRRQIGKRLQETVQARVRVSFVQ